jgi:hypothetical protein
VIVCHRENVEFYSLSLQTNTQTSYPTCKTPRLAKKLSSMRAAHQNCTPASSSFSSLTGSSTPSPAVAFAAFFFLLPLGFFSATMVSSSSSSTGAEAALPLRPFFAVPVSVSAALRFYDMCQ